MFDMAYIIEVIKEELSHADKKYPPMAEPIEGLHTIKCEIAELEREVMRAEKDPGHMTKEAIQVAAMALKFLRDCCAHDGDSL